LSDSSEQEERLRAEVTRLRDAAAELDRTTQALRDSEQRLSQLVRQCPIAVIEWDADFRVIEWNAAAERIFGYTRDEMLGEHARRIIPEAVRPLVDHIWEDLTSQRGGTRSRNENVTASGESITCEWYNGPRVDDEGQVVGVISLAQDVTELARNEEERRLLELRMVEAAKLESLGILAGGVAHDFNNLLVGIVGATSLALHELPVGSSVRDHLELVASSADRAAELTRQMLAYSGKGRFVVGPVDLGALVREMARLVEASISKRATMDYRIGDVSAMVEGDATQLRQVVMNLILNASDAVSEQGGEIAVSTGVVCESAAFLRTTWLHDELPAGEYAFVAVTDTGVGMDEATRSRIFDPFFTTKTRGHGLGLAAAQGIVRAHRGFIEVESVPGAGTRIRVGFPLRAAEIPPEIVAKDESAAPSGSGTVLLADDEKVVREVARVALEAEGFEVREAADGVVALELFAAEPDAFRALIIDLTMPRMSGAELLEQVRALAPKVPVVLMSGFDERDVTSRVGSRGSQRFLQKPFRPEELVRALQGVLSTA